MPSINKIVTDVLKSLDRSATEPGQRRVTGNDKSPARKRSSEMSATLDRLKRTTAPRTNTATEATRRDIGGAKLRRAPSVPARPTSPFSQTASRVPPDQHAVARTHSRRSQSNNDLQRALTESHTGTILPPTSQAQESADLDRALALSRADLFMAPVSADQEDANLQQALALSHAEAFRPPSSPAEEASQLQQALALSRSDVFSPPSSAAEEDAQLRQALANSNADALPPRPPAARENAPLSSAAAPPESAQSKPRALSPQEDMQHGWAEQQTLIQIAMQQGERDRLASKQMDNLARN